MKTLSNQEVAQRIEMLEDKIDFVLKATPVMVRSKVTGPDGQPRAIQTNLFNVYRDAKAAGLTIGVPAEQAVGDEVV